MNHRTGCLLILAAALALPPASASAQSSSLYVQPADQPPASQQRDPSGRDNPNHSPPISASLVAASLIAVHRPPPHPFAVQDLITIIISEDTKADSSATLNTDKQDDITGQMQNMPNFAMLKAFSKLLGATNPTNSTNMALTFENKFQSQGQYDREDSITSRITARIVDVKPNGTLVLEARKYIKSDKESLNMVLSGTCRKEDVTSDNTITSSQIYDLHLEKQHSGELHNTTKKGVLAKFFEYLFNF